MLKKTVFMAIAALALFVSGTAASASTQVIVNGSTTVLPVVQAAAETFMKGHPDVSISISGGGSGNGIKAIIDGTTDIAMSSRFLKDNEIKTAMEKGVYPVPFRVAVDAIVPVVHPGNPVKNLTIEQLSLMYQGKITNWKEVGGEDLKIVLISRDTSSGTYEVWEEKVLHKARVAPQAQLQASNGAVAQAVSKNRYAIGYIGIGYLNRDLKGVKVNDIEASRETALSGAYPVARPLFVFVKGWPAGAVSDFIHYLVSPEGQEIVKKEGFIPLY